jgi:hypothetical protein
MKSPLRQQGVKAEKPTDSLLTPQGERRPLRDWLTGETWEPLVVAGAWHPHRVSKAARTLWPNQRRAWCPRRKAYLYTWPELQEIAAFLGKEKWR